MEPIPSTQPQLILISLTMPGPGPAGPPPPQVNKGPGILAVTWVETSIGLLVLGARLYTRARIVRNVGWDDWCIVFATVRPALPSP